MGNTPLYKTINSNTMFSGLKPGATLYVLDKSGEPKVVTGYVEHISVPHPMYPNYNPAVSFGSNL